MDCTEYDPLKAGSRDGTDSEPHDRAICRALSAKHIPPKHIESRPTASLFVGRLPLHITEQDIRHLFDKYASIVKVCLVKDIVTGMSKGYAFVELKHRGDVSKVLRDTKGLMVDGKEVVVEREAGRTLRGWKPRRLGGGWGGKKEAGQLRFGCVSRPWLKPDRKFSQ